MKYKIITDKNKNNPAYFEGTPAQAENFFRKLCDKYLIYDDERYFNFDETISFIEGWGNTNGIETVSMVIQDRTSNRIRLHIFELNDVDNFELYMLSYDS